MSDLSTATSSSTRLPLADLPATVLPGTVITLALVTDSARRAVESATGGPDRRVLLRAGDDQLAVVAQVPDIGSLPTGEPAAIVRVEARARIAAVHASERGATFADAEVLRDPRPTPRVEALGRELRVVLEEIAQLRRSRRLPELLRAGLDPGSLADGVATWAEFEEGARRDVLAAVDVAERVQLVLTWAREPPRRAAGRRVHPQRRHRGRRQAAARVSPASAAGRHPQGARRGRRRRRRRVPHEAAVPRGRRRGAQLHRQGDRPPGAHQRPVAGAGLDPHVAGPRLRAAVGRP